MAAAMLPRCCTALLRRQAPRLGARRLLCSASEAAPSAPPAAAAPLAAPLAEPAAPHPFARPEQFMGAWYTLRGEDDEVMQRNRARKKQRRPQIASKFIMRMLDRREVDAFVRAEPWRAGLFKVGDTLEVEAKPSLNERPERFVGLCIARHNRGVGASFRLLAKPDNLPVEYLFFLHNPLLCSIEVRATPAKRVRTRKLLYMRGRVRELKFPTPRPTDAEGNLLPEHHRAPTKKKKRRGKS